MKKGFTLIELLAVIVIIAIIALIAMPQITKLVDNVKLKADLESVRGYLNAADTYYMKAQFDSNLYSTLGTNVIDKLPVKGEKLNGSVIINDKGKVELSIIKNKKCYRKSFNDTELEVEEEGMCSIANAKSVSQAGQLHVCGRFLCDKDNNTVRIVGISGGMLGSQAELTNPSSLPVRGEINATSLKTLRSWGANGYRIFAEAKIPGVASYIGYEDQFISKVKQVIDAAIEADMYIIVNWDPARNGGVPFTDQAMDFFNRISTMYKNDPHILYEIWNEPEANNSWDQIKAHADKIIPVIRKNSPNAIVLVGSPSADLKLDLVVNDPLTYPNVMYTHHMYMSSLTDEAVSKLVNAYNAGLPLFETEWGSMGLGLNDPMVMKPQAKAYVSLLNRLGISNLAFTFATSTDIDDNRFGIVVRGNWRDDLPDSILKENGKFYKNVLQGGTGDFKANLMKGFINSDDKSNYRSDEWREKIVSIKFKTSLSVPKDAVKTWDVSLAQDKSIIAYLTKTNTTDRYDMTIAADGTINAPANAQYLFANMTNLKSIDFTNFETYATFSVNAMFLYDSNLEYLDLSGFDTSKIYMMWNTFSACTKLKSINFNNWHPKITSWGSTFFNCYSLESLDLSGFDVSGSKTFGTLFYNNKALKKLNISTWNPKTTTNLDMMFINCSSLEEVDMSNFLISDGTSLDKTLNNVKSNAKIIVNNQSVIDKLSPTANNTLNFVIKG